VAFPQAPAIVMTDSALALLRRVKDERGEELVLVIGNGCCDATAPYLFANYLPGPTEHQVGEIENVPVFLDDGIASNFSGTEVVVDVREDAEEEDSFSCETELGQRFCLDRLPSS
jgi:uncharacterized protein (DUF779 family)